MMRYVIQIGNSFVTEIGMTKLSLMGIVKTSMNINNAFLFNDITDARKAKAKIIRKDKSVKILEALVSINIKEEVE